MMLDNCQVFLKQCQEWYRTLYNLEQHRCTFSFRIYKCQISCIFFIDVYVLCTRAYNFSYFVLQFGVFPLMPAQAMTQQVDIRWCLFILPVKSMYLWIHHDLILCVSVFQATRHARRVYVGGLPPLANEQVQPQFLVSCLCDYILL
jgi:hypothetical protein